MLAEHLPARRGVNRSQLLLADSTERRVKIESFRRQEEYFASRYAIDLYNLSVEDKSASLKLRSAVGDVTSSIEGYLLNPPEFRVNE